MERNINLILSQMRVRIHITVEDFIISPCLSITSSVGYVLIYANKQTNARGGGVLKYVFAFNTISVEDSLFYKG